MSPVGITRNSAEPVEAPPVELTDNRDRREKPASHVGITRNQDQQERPVPPVGITRNSAEPVEAPPVELTEH